MFPRGIGRGKCSTCGNNGHTQNYCRELERIRKINLLKREISKHKAAIERLEQKIQNLELQLAETQNENN